MKHQKEWLLTNDDEIEDQIKSMRNQIERKLFKKDLLLLLIIFDKKDNWGRKEGKNKIKEMKMIIEQYKNLWELRRVSISRNINIIIVWILLLIIFLFKLSI